MKAASDKNRKAQEFLNIEDISGNLLWTADKHLIGFLSVSGNDNSLLQDNENDLLTSRMAAALSEEMDPWQLLAVPRTVDTQGMLDTLTEMRQSCDNSARRMLLDGEINSLEEMTAAGVKEPMMIIKLWTKAALGADRELISRMSRLAARLNDCGLSARTMEDKEIHFLCRVYSDLGVYHEAEVEPEDVTILAAKKRRFREKKNTAELQRAALLDELAPVGGFFFEPNRIKVGGALVRCYAVTRYPSQVPYGWAVSLTNSADMVTCITYYPGKQADLGNAISKGAKQANRDAVMESDLRQKKAYERQVQGAAEMLEAMDSQGGAVGHMSITVMVYGRNESQLEQSCQRAMTRFSTKRMTLKALASVQKTAWQHMSPYYAAQDLIAEMTRHIVPLETVVGGYPATVFTIRDNSGLYFAKASDNGIISLDFSVRDMDRTNGNGVIFGIPGIGKSTVAKHIIQSMFMRGVKVIIIDPQGEYEEMCRILGGSWWDAGSGRSKNNPLQVRDLHLETVDENGEPIPIENQVSPMMQHMQMLYTILKYKLPGLTAVQFELLKRVLRTVYGEFGITMDQKEFSSDPKAYPVLEDVYRWLLNHSDEDPGYKTLALFLEDMAIGAEAQLWNGYTDINMDSDLVVIDTKNLSDAPVATQAAQYYNLLQLAYSEATKDKTTPYLIVADEGHLLFNPSVPEAGSIVKKISKEIRKYEGYFWLITQSLVDMHHEQVSFYGEAVTDCAAYKILFGCDGKNLAKMVDLFDLNQAEKTFLEARQRGVALCLIGSKHIKARFDLAPYKLELMGTGGGR